MRVDALAHDALQADGRAHEAYRNESERVCPRRVASRLRDAGLVSLPSCDRGGHCKERLDESAKEEPQPCVISDFIAQTADGGSCEEGEEGGEGLAIGDAEGEVGLPGREEASECEGKLEDISSSKYDCIRIIKTRTWTVLPVWKPHHTKIAEKEIESLHMRTFSKVTR